MNDSKQTKILVNQETLQMIEKHKILLKEDYEQLIDINQQLSICNDINKPFWLGLQTDLLFLIKTREQFISINMSDLVIC